MQYEYLSKCNIYTIDSLIKSRALLSNISDANRLLTREQQWTAFRVQTEEAC